MLLRNVLSQFFIVKCFRKPLLFNNNNNVHLYTAHIGRQHIEGHPHQCTQRPDHNTGNYVPYSTTPPPRTVSGFFNVPQRVVTNKGCETGPTVYRRYLNHLQMSLQRQHFSSVHLKILSGGPAGV